MKRFYHIPVLLFLGFNLVVFNSFSQDSIKIDSLTKLFEEASNDSVKVSVLQQLFWEHRRSDLEKALECATKSLKLSKSSKNAQGIPMGQYMMAVIFKEQGKYNEASDLLTEAMSDFQKLNDTIRIVSCLTDLADLYRQQDEYEKALGFLEEARNLVILIKNNNKLGRIYNMTGMLFLAQNQWDKALEYYNKSLELNELENFKLGMSVNYNNIGSVYLELEDYPRAKMYYLKSYEIKKERNDASGIAAVLANLGRICFLEKKYEEAIAYHQQSLGKYTEMGDQSGIAICLINLGDDYLEAQNYGMAIEFAQKAINISTKYNLKGSLTEAYRILSGAYSGSYNFEKGLHYYKLYKSYNDSIQNVEVVKQITEIEAKFENEKKEKEIAILNGENEKQELQIEKHTLQRNMMVGLIALVLLILIFLSWGYRNKQKLNKELEELNQTKSRFFANISHEFRTPLTLLLGPIEKLMNNAKQDDKEIIGMMHRNATRLLFLDNQLLDLSKLEAGKLSLQVSQAELSQALKGMVTSFLSFAEKKKVDFTYTFPDQDILAFFDQDKLEKIVYNLLSNALKFTPENGQVIFELSVVSTNQRKELPLKIRKIPGRLVCISVKDTGPGIATHHLQNIFDRFYQVASRQNRSFEGTGLGLSLSKELVELHHGKIMVESELGKGCTFRIYLPIDKKAFEPHEITNYQNASHEISAFTSIIQTEDRTIISDSETASAASELEESIHVLLVEDNQDMRFYIRDCFDKQFHILEAPNGITGFETAITEIPDIIITDLIMPKMDGIELCNKLKTDERTSHIPVILLTALSSVEDRIKGLETGADDYIAKPFNRKELLTRVQNLTEQRKLLRERFSKEIKIQAKDIAVTSADEKFLNKLISFIENNLADPDLNVDSLIEEINLSRSQLHRKLKALTGLSSTEFVRTIRLKRAAQLLEQHHGTIAETVYAVGFNSLSYFSKCFQKQFNMTPKEYLEQS